MKPGHLKYVAMLVTVVSVSIFAMDIHGPWGLSVNKIRPILEQFLLREKYNGCPGYASISYLRKIKVGKFSEKADGWPVFASYKLTCKGRSGTAIYKWPNNQEETTPVAFVRKNASGNPEFFLFDSTLYTQQKVQLHMRTSFENLQYNEHKRIEASQCRVSKPKPRPTSTCPPRRSRCRR